MPARLRVYLDTSVISAYVDSRDRARQELTREFWTQLAAYETFVCPVVIEEIQQTADPSRREEMVKLTEPLTLLTWDPEMEGLATSYLQAGVFTPALIQDARHVAACVVAGIPVLLSWNFRHLVNRTRRIRVNLLNSQLGYEQLEIIAPPELM